MKKRILIGVLCLSMAFFTIGCGDDTRNINTTTNSSSEEEKEINSDESDNSEEQSSLDMLYERNGELTGYTIITPYVQIILATDGKVLAKGQNRYGQLGNGERTDTESWSEVEGLSDIIKIYSLGSIGNEVSDEYGYGHCYALNSSGKLYRWGGNILTPEAVFANLTIKEMKSLTSNKLFIRCESGEKYILVARPGLYADDSVFSYNSLPDDAELYGYEAGDGFFVYSNDELSYVDTTLEYADSIDEISPIEDKIKSIILINTSEKMKNIIPCSYKGFGGAVFITDSGSVMGAEYENGEINIENRDGSGIKKASLNDTSFILFNNGTLNACGDNEFGQLGDGTNNDYDDGYLEIKQNLFSDFEYYSWPELYCIALNYQYNVWGWGKGLGSTPSIIVENTDFINNQ